MTIGYLKILNQLKDQEILALFLREEAKRILKVEPEDVYIRIISLDEDSQSIQVVDRELLSESEINGAYSIGSDSFGSNDDRELNIVRRWIEVKERKIHFVSKIHTLKMNRYGLSLQVKDDYEVAVDCSKLPSETNIADAIEFTDYGANCYRKNYGQLYSLLSNQCNDYLGSYVQGKGFSILSEEAESVLANEYNFLREIGFKIVADEKKSYFKSKSFGTRYHYDVLMKYLFLVFSKPEVVKQMWNGDTEEIYHLLFRSDDTTFAKHIQDLY